MELSIQNLSKTYPNGVQALKNVTLNIPQGMFGLLGPNGAGKSTLMRTIATLQEPDEGSISLGDINVLTQKEEVRKLLGYLPQEFGVYPRMGAETLLDHLAVLKGITNRKERKEVVQALLQKTNLYDHRKKNLGGYSGGMKQRFGIAQALLANPQLIIVDEPTAGLDPAERNRFLNLLSELGENTIVILSTHIVEDVKELCTNMAVINKGEVLLTGTPSAALANIKGKIWRKQVSKEDLEQYKVTHNVISERRSAGKPVIHVFSDFQPEDGFISVEPDLEDVYFSEIFGKQLMVSNFKFQIPNSKYQVSNSKYQIPNFKFQNAIGYKPKHQFLMLEILKFELKYRAKRPATYIYFVIMFLLAFCAITTDVIHVGGSSGQVKENAPTTISFFLTILSVIPGVLLASAVMGVPILRDFEHKTASMMFTTPITKYQYLGGRFLGSLLVTIFIFSGIFFGMALGYLMPWIDQEKLLPYNLGHMIQPFLIFVLPNIFIMACLFFASGALSRKLLMVYIQGIFLFVIYSIATQLLSDWENQDLGALIDPFGFITNRHVTRYWTVAERNSLTVGMTGLILWNRLLWMGIALLTLLFTFWKFDFNIVGKASKKKLKQATKNNIPTAVSTNIPIPSVQQFSGFSTQMGQIGSLAIFYFKWIVNQIPFLAITIGGMIFVLAGFFSGLGGMYDVDVYPTTYRVLELLSGFSLFLFIITILYAGELIWKERDVKINLIYDALPYPNYVVLVGKFLAMILMYIVVLAALGLAGIIAQTIMGYTNFELGVYFNALYIETLSSTVLLAFLAFFIHTLVNHKFIGHALLIVFFISTLVLFELGFEHRMFHFASAGLGRYSDMNGFGHYFSSFNWFSIYWLGLALVFFAVVLFFAVRGAENSMKMRWRLGKLRVNRSLLTFGLGAILLFFLSGCYVYYNTNVLNTYRNSDDQNTLQADYEKTLKKYEKEPLLKIVDTYIEVDIYPETRDFKAKGKYVLKNKTEAPIQKIYLQRSYRDEMIDSVSFNVPTSIADSWDPFKFYIYELASPMQPGDSITMNFISDYKTDGFVEGGSNTEILNNGTFFNNTYFPTFGYQANYELGSDDDREDNNLPEKERMRPRDDEHGVKENLIGGVADRIRFEIIMSTSNNQIAIAPGYLQKEWEEEGRKYFHYKMDVPILNFYSMVSAEYEVVRDKWSNGKQEVNLEIYYHKGHEFNLDRMLSSMNKSLDYFTKNFSPYQYRQLRIMEFPRYRSFAQSFSNTVPFSEEIGFMLKVGEDDVDIPFYVTAHEIAHQWWAHQVTEAGVQGNAMSSETMSQYSALMVMKQEFPPEIIQKFLKLELDRYLRGRAGETKKEQPLDHVEGQGYIHYRKGSLIMYALQDYIGEDSVNLALRRIIDKWAYKEDRYITSDVYLEEFRKVTPDSLQYIITDLFETITLFENRVKEATYEENGENNYTVQLDVSAIKYRSDSLGNEAKIPINDWIDVGVYTEDEKGEDQLIYLQKHKVNEEEMKFTIPVSKKPSKAGIDPINVLIDRNPADNRKRVVLKEAG